MNRETFAVVLALIARTSTQLTPCPAAPIANTPGLQSSSTGGTMQTLTCTGGTFPGGLTFQTFFCNMLNGQWSPTPAITACGGGGGVGFGVCPATPVTNTAGLQSSSIAGSTQTVLCTNPAFTFPNGLNSNMFICTNGFWGPQNPSIYACTQPAATSGSCSAAPVANTPGLQSSSTGGTMQTLTCTGGTFPGGLTFQTFFCNMLNGQWSPTPAITACGGGFAGGGGTACSAMPVTNTAGLQSSSIAGSTQTVLCTNPAFTFPNGLNSNMFICTNGFWGPQNPSIYACTQPAATSGTCLAAPVANTPGLQSSTTGGAMQTLICAGGTFPGGLTSQTFFCNSLTGQWSPNPSITVCGSGTTGTSAATQTMINKAYCWILGRCADSGGSQAFGNTYTMDGNQMLPVVQGLVNSNEFYTKYVANYPTGPVDALYFRLLGRAADPGGKAYWTSQAASQGWQVVALGITKSAEFQSKMSLILSPTSQMACICNSG